MYGDAYCAEQSVNRFGPLITTDGAFLRADYLNWNTKTEKYQLLGAPVANNPNPAVPFTIFAPGTSTPVGFGSVPTNNGIDFSGQNGIRVTGGVSFLNGGSLEASAFFLGRRQSGYTVPLGQPVQTTILLFGLFPFPGPVLPNVLATSTLANGQVSDHLFLYNQSFSVQALSQIWGGDMTYLMDYDVSGPLQFRPLIGARYINFTERLTQVGVFADQFLGTPPFASTIQSLAINNLWGAQVGFRSSFVSKYVEFGVTPKLLLLGNTMVSTVRANQFRSITDPASEQTDVTNKFTFGSDLEGFASINITPSFSIRAGYNFMWFNTVSRPTRNIVYDDRGPAVPAIGEKTFFQSVIIHGASFGGELRF
jgi:hypothetical protein